MQKFEKYLTKAGTISPNAPVEIRAEYFVCRAREVHGDRYTYDPALFTSTKVKTQITCPEHGIFEQTPALHLAGRGCPKCKAGSSGKDPTAAIQDLIDKFPNLDFSVSKYCGSLSNVTFRCPVHGEQSLVYSSLLKSTSKGCPICSRDRRSQKQLVLEKLAYVHGDKYDYGKLPDTLSGREHVTIVCSEHGEFQQLLRKHLEGQGCPSCSHRDSNILYLLKHPTDNVFKIGVTSKHRVALRLAANRKASNLDLVVIRSIEVEDALAFEQELLKRYTNNPYLNEGFVGYTEYRKLSETELAEVLSYMDSIS